MEKVKRVDDLPGPGVGPVPGQVRSDRCEEQHVATGGVDLVVGGAQDVDAALEVEGPHGVQVARVHLGRKPALEVDQQVVGEDADIGVGDVLGRRDVRGQRSCVVAVDEARVDGVPGIDLDPHGVGHHPPHAEGRLAVADVGGRDAAVALPPVVALQVEGSEPGIVRDPEQGACEVVGELADDRQVERGRLLVPGREGAVEELVAGLPFDVGRIAGLGRQGPGKHSGRWWEVDVAHRCVLLREVVLFGRPSGSSAALRRTWTGGRR